MTFRAPSGWRVLAGALALAVVASGCAQPGPVPQVERFRHAIEGTKPWTHENFDNGGDKFTFGIFADLTGGEREGVFSVAVEQLNLLRPELIVNVGDLIDGGSDDDAELNRQWDSFDERALRTRAPIFYAGGNHDLTGEVSREVWKERLGPRYYHFVYKNVLFLVLDTEDHTAERMRDIEQIRLAGLEIYKTEGPEAFATSEYANLPERISGNIGPEQSAYFTQAIADNPDVRWTFLLMHKPAWEKEGETTFAAMETALAERPYTVFYGHTHIFGYLERHGRDYINLATTGGAFFPEGRRSTDQRSMDQVVLVTVDDDEVSIANLLMEGILDKTGKIPLNGEELDFELPSEGSR